MSLRRIRACTAAGRPAACGYGRAFGQHGLRPCQIAGFKQDGPKQPEQVGAHLLIGRAGRERAFEPVPGLLPEAAGNPEAAQRPGQPRPGLITRAQ